MAFKPKVSSRVGIEQHFGELFQVRGPAIFGDPQDQSFGALYGTPWIGIINEQGIFELWTYDSISELDEGFDFWKLAAFGINRWSNPVIELAAQNAPEPDPILQEPTPAPDPQVPDDPDPYDPDPAPTPDPTPVPGGGYDYTVSTLRALSQLSPSPGDRILVQSGTDRSLEQGSIFIRFQGTLANPITVVFEEGYTLNSSNLTAGTGADKPWWVDCEYVNVYGGYHYRSPSYGWFFRNNNGCNFYNMHTYEAYIDGFILFTNNTTNNFYDCTAKGGYQGGDADGFYVHDPSDVGNSFYRCLAERNSDDGFDAWRSNNTSFIDCLAVGNGRSYNNVYGDGNGFKMGSATSGAGQGAVALRCKAWDNRAVGLTYNGMSGSLTVTDVVCWRNNRNYEIHAAATVSGSYSSVTNVANYLAGSTRQGVTDIAQSAFQSLDPNNPNFLEI